MNAIDPGVDFAELVRHVRRAQKTFFAAAKGDAPESDRRFLREACQFLERKLDPRIRPVPSGDELNDLVAHMRSYQRAYFARAMREDMLVAKDYERRVDLLLEEAVPSLFSPRPEVA